MKTQKDMVLEYLKHGGCLTHRTAENLFGATRLADIVFKLRKEGYDIRTEMIKTKNKFGRATEFAAYKLEN